jgi:formylglycine-generating enzyme required for sulfatase activity
MATIPAGAYMPLYADAGRTAVAAFKMDVTPVTRAQYLQFVTQNPAWRRGAVKSHEYLKDWPGVFDAGSGTELQRPVTQVPLAAARAYCSAQGKRLPSVDEWEYAAAASRKRRDGTADAAFRQELLALYTRIGKAPRPVGSTFTNVYGVSDLHGLVWEWTEVAHDHSHHAAGHHDMSCAGSAQGASSTSDFAAFLRYAYRSGLTDGSTQSNLGFRCAAGM